MSIVSATISDRNSSRSPLSFSDNFFLSPSGRRGHCVPILRMDVCQMSARNSSGNGLQWRTFEIRELISCQISTWLVGNPNDRFSHNNDNFYIKGG